jgi:hypothetical protein
MKMLSYHLKIDRCYIDERAISILSLARSKVLPGFTDLPVFLIVLDGHKM